MLIVVHPPFAGQGSRALWRWRPRSHPPFLTDAETRRRHAPALRNLKGLYGSGACPAGIMGARVRRLGNTTLAPHRSSPAMTRHAARAARIMVHSPLSAPVPTDRCRSSERGL